MSLPWTPYLQQGCIRARGPPSSPKARWHKGPPSSLTARLHRAYAAILRPLLSSYGLLHHPAALLQHPAALYSRNINNSINVRNVEYISSRIDGGTSRDVNRSSRDTNINNSDTATAAGNLPGTPWLRQKHRPQQNQHQQQRQKEPYGQQHRQGRWQQEGC